MTVKTITADATIRMGKSVESFKTDLTRLRTGRAHPSLLDHVTVDYYGNQTPITQTANVAVEDARTLSVTVWDQSMVEAIEKAILESDLGLNPSTAGTVIRIPLPPLTEDRRKELIKLIKNEAEQTKVAVRNIRRDAISHIKTITKSKEISKDDERRADGVIQKITDEHVSKIDEIVAAKEQELLEV
jgi:ribosome recycling factor